MDRSHKSRRHFKTTFSENIGRKWKWTQNGILCFSFIILIVTFCAHKLRSSNNQYFYKIINKIKSKHLSFRNTHPKPFFNIKIG